MLIDEQTGVEDSVRYGLKNPTESVNEEEDYIADDERVDAPTVSLSRFLSAAEVFRREGSLRRRVNIIPCQLRCIKRSCSSSRSRHLI